jgi:RpiR family carbohydrate utilization transcriptional regulator
MIGVIRNSLAKLTPAERRVAEIILDTPHTAITWSISDAARMAKVSEPTVIRFCRQLGCDGFPSFRLRLAQALTVLRPETEPVLSGKAKPEAAVLDDIFARAGKAIDEARADMDIAVLRKSVKLLVGARRIDIYGYGGSGFIASEAQHRFASLGLASVSYSDPTLQMVSAPMLRRQDAVLAISFSGRNSYLIGNVELAKKAGARIVSIAPSGSLIAEIADQNIGLNAHRSGNSYNYVPTGRVAMHVVLDALTALMAGAMSFSTSAASASAPLRR